MKSECLPLISATIPNSIRVIAEAKHRFDLYTTGKDKSAVNKNLRAAIFGIAIRQGGKSEYSSLKHEWHTTTSPDGREIALRALGRIQDPELLPDYLSLLFNDVATQDMHTGAVALATNPKARHGLWEYIQTNFDQIREKLGKNMVVLDRFLRLSLNKFNDKKTEQEIVRFFEGRDNRGYDRTLNVVSDTILGRAKYQERDAEVILEWLKTHGYA
jgi:aminopeptidase N